jgi:hypothetical protein
MVLVPLFYGLEVTKFWNIVIPNCANINLRPHGFGFSYFNVYLEHIKMIVSTVLPVTAREMADREGVPYKCCISFKAI